MKTIKNEMHNLNKMRPTFFWFGMIISLLLVITAFEWRSTYDIEIMKRGTIVDEMPEIIQITKQDEPKPPKPKKIAVTPVITVVDDDQDIEDIKVVIDLLDITDDMLDSMITEMPEEIDNTVYYPGLLESDPKPKDGFEGFYRFISKNVQYPSQAQQLGIEGRVTVQFIIDKQGAITELEVLRGVGAGCDEEALRVLSIAPKWSPGKQRGVPVKVRMALPITFKLN